MEALPEDCLNKVVILESKITMKNKRIFGSDSGEPREDQRPGKEKRTSQLG